MGMNAQVYLGPYVECRYRVFEATKVIHTCTKTDCAEHGKSGASGAFCCMCGSPLGDVEQRVERRVYPDELIGDDLCDLSGNMYDPSDRLFLGANHKSPRPFIVETTQTQHLDIASIDREAEMRWFEQRYARSIAIIRENYDDVTIKWGFHLFWW